MPYLVKHMIEGKSLPICVNKEDTVTEAISLMIEHDFSQLPVIIKKADNVFNFPIGMITYESILRGIRNFNAKLEDLKVRDVIVSAPIYTVDDDLFDILNRLKDANAVLITVDFFDLVGIVTSFDATEYFRNRTEDLMRVEDIELMLKDFILEAYNDDTGNLIEEKLQVAIDKISIKSNPTDTRKKTFNQLSLGEYIALLTLKETWTFFESVLNVKRCYVNDLLEGVREARNDLAHFRGDISAQQRDRLKFAVEWLSRCQEEYQTKKHEYLIDEPIEDKPAESVKVETVVLSSSRKVELISPIDFSVITEPAKNGGRYVTLADWLQSQPGRIDKVQLSFNEIETIIGGDLPASARSHRAWWANDTVSHSHSQLWLDAGWRRTALNLSEGKVTFARIQEREKAYIAFFSKLVSDLRTKADFQIKDLSPDGTSWIVIQNITHSGKTPGIFVYSFSRDKRFRIELYLDLGEKEATKTSFNKLLEQKDAIEGQLGSVEWEKLDHRRASRIAIYHDGQITETENHPRLQSWAVDTMIQFINTLREPAEKAISEVMG
jgi:CBS domain-containing protein